MLHRKVAIAAAVAALAVVCVSAAPAAVSHVIPLRSLRILSTARAQTDSPITGLATAVDTADQDLATVQGQVIGWQLAGASFVPSLTQVMDPSGNVGFQSSAGFNAWVLLFDAPQQCGWSTYEGWVIVDDGSDTPAYASVLATHPAAQVGSTCTLQDTGATPPPAVPPLSFGTGPLPPAILNSNCGPPTPPSTTVAWLECQAK